MPGRKGSGICEEYYAQSYQGSRGTRSQQVQFDAIVRLERASMGNRAKRKRQLQVCVFTLSGGSRLSM